MENTAPEKIVYTLTAKCRDCYRCLKVCPVKAIKMKNGQAYVDAERCIACGTCIRECPQNAKTYISSLHEVKKILAENECVAASIAPSFAAFFPGWQAKRIPSALRQLGFEFVAETSEAAYGVACSSAQKALQRKKDAAICTACPAVVNYVEKYRPELVPTLLPVVSPMIAHARKLKEENGADSKVIFIGPCVAKKHEALRPEYQGIVDSVLTFEELSQWLIDEKLDLKNCEESGIDGISAGYSRLFPLPGGMLRTAGINAQAGDMNYIHLSGAEDVIQAFDAKGLGAVFMEPLFCQEGCINGPGAKMSGNIFEKRKNLIEYAGNMKPVQVKEYSPKITERESFSDKYAFKQNVYTDEEIKTVYEKTGKSDGLDLLNCGACGYKGCREKAIAVLDGMAEVEMCVPYMRRLAEQRTDMIIETSPNGIVVLDHDLKIIKMNPAFRKFFNRTDTYLGSHISMIMDPAHFEKLASGAIDNIDINGESNSNGYSFHELFYALRQYGQYVGIFVDITNLKQDREKLEIIRRKTAGQAKEMLDEQVKMSQEIAWQLGENMARSEELVRKLTELSGDGGADDNRRGK
jgi:iron only hydrogenase large subunit-like protein